MVEITENRVHEIDQRIGGVGRPLHVLYPLYRGYCMAIAGERLGGTRVVN
jgi:hypothetical protein